MLTSDQIIQSITEQLSFQLSLRALLNTKWKEIRENSPGEFSPQMNQNEKAITILFEILNNIKSLNKDTMAGLEQNLFDYHVNLVDQRSLVIKHMRLTVPQFNLGPIISSLSSLPYAIEENEYRAFKPKKHSTAGAAASSPPSTASAQSHSSGASSLGVAGSNQYKSFDMTFADVDDSIFAVLDEKLVGGTHPDDLLHTRPISSSPASSAAPSSSASSQLSSTLANPSMQTKPNQRCSSSNKSHLGHSTNRQVLSTTPTRLPPTIRRPHHHTATTPRRPGDTSSSPMPKLSETKTVIFKQPKQSGQQEAASNPSVAPGSNPYNNG